RRGESRGHLFGDLERALDRQATLLDFVPEVRPFDELADEVRSLSLPPDVEDRHDVRVGERRGRPGLELEPSEAVGVRRIDRRERLDRDLAPEPRVARAVDLPHAAGAEWGEDLVRTEAAADGECHVVYLHDCTR